jgi:N-acetylglucosaminyl-diphospho-decaprenol L-rhamnosyltransferase
MLARLLASLERQTRDHEVVVVDNGSTDGTRALLAEQFPGVHLVSLPTNLGFGRAVNRGVAETQGRKLVFLNNDVVCDSEFVERITEALDPLRGVVMAAGVLLQELRPHLIDTAGIEFDSTLLAFDYLHGTPKSVLENGVRDPLGPCCGAAAFDRSAFESLGGFDEHFFAYLEDVDLTVRMIAAGGRCRLAPAAVGIHRHSATLGPRSRRKNELISWGRGYMIGKYRLHRHPGLFCQAVIGEVVGALGKLLVDRTAVCINPRLAGWRAGLRSDPHPLPALSDGARVSFIAGQRRRVARRLEWLQEGSSARAERTSDDI